MAKNKYENENTENAEIVEYAVDWVYVWLDADGGIRNANYTSFGETPKIQRFNGSACKQASTDNPICSWFQFVL